MTDPQLIGLSPAVRLLSPRYRAIASARFHMIFLRKRPGGLEIMSLLAAVLWVLGTVGDRLALLAMTHGNRIWLHGQATDVIAGISVVASWALSFYIRKGDRDPRFLLDLGLVYMVFTSAALGLMIHWFRVPKEWPVSPMISWVGAVVLMSSAIVPNSPMKTLIAGLIAVSMNPLGMLMARARGIWDFGSLGNVLVMHYPDYLLVGVAVVISRVVTRLGQQVTRAREMGSYRLVARLGEVYFLGL